MPVYEYECNSCGDKFEIRRSIFEVGDKPRCPKCSSKSTSMVFSPASHTSSDCGSSQSFG